MSLHILSGQQSECAGTKMSFIKRDLLPWDLLLGALSIHFFFTYNKYLLKLKIIVQWKKTTNLRNIDMKQNLYSEHVVYVCIVKIYSAYCTYLMIDWLEVFLAALTSLLFLEYMFVINQKILIIVQIISLFNIPLLIF